MLSLQVSALLAADSAALGLFLGTVDSARPNQDSQYGVEYQFARRLTDYGFRPIAGLMRTRDASHYFYSGISRHSAFTESATGLALAVSLAAGLYLHGGGADTDLGHPLELRTSVGLEWLFADATRVGVHFAHLSNASIAAVNPGTELVTLSYALAL